jgi:hypothetical protein
MQYVVLIAPLLVLVSMRWALAWFWLAGAFIAIRYAIPFLTDKSYESFHNFHFRELALAVGVLAWALLALFVWDRLRPHLRAAL